MDLYAFGQLPKEVQAKMMAFVELENERKEELRQQLNSEDPNFILSQIILLNG